MGMWLFLMTELLLFSGMFLLYSSYRYFYTKEFHEAAMYTHTLFGTVNTMVLLTSSLTMALSITAIERGKKWLSVTFLSSTIVLGLGFLVIKYVEWSTEIGEGIYPGSPMLFQHPRGFELFFAMYYLMTGLHGLHVLVGCGILITMLIFILQGKITQEDSVRLEAAGLYWHLIDIIWIFLFPLFYLVN
ncbi:MAG: cytochrome c oxidase subunit 3 family protein [Bacteroidetes bacterium]|nr:cytochrome c oxidase subunit 3 family protein [Bacteroidota bacterium]